MGHPDLDGLPGFGRATRGFVAWHMECLTGGVELRGWSGEWRMRSGLRRGRELF
jgi:hypothetical protein